MCGEFQHLKYKNEPVWKISKDRKHISFYADRDTCENKTDWCEEHCNLVLNPPPKEITAHYNIKQFTSAIKQQPFYNDFMEAQFVTIFASGCLGAIEEIENETDILDIIEEIALFHPEKIFRFFIREELGDCEIIPGNIIINFSVDCDTKIGLLSWALLEPKVFIISVIDHPDNENTKRALSNFKFNKIIRCRHCETNDYKCFSIKSKTLLIQDFKDKK